AQGQAWHIAPLYGPAAGGKKDAPPGAARYNSGEVSSGCVRLGHERGTDQSPRMAPASLPGLRRPALPRRGAGRAIRRLAAHRQVAEQEETAAEAVAAAAPL